MRLQYGLYLLSRLSVCPLPNCTMKRPRKLKVAMKLLRCLKLQEWTIMEDIAGVDIAAEMV